MRLIHGALWEEFWYWSHRFQQKVRWPGHTTCRGWWEHKL